MCKRRANLKSPRFSLKTADYRRFSDLQNAHTGCQFGPHSVDLVSATPWPSPRFSLSFRAQPRNLAGTHGGFSARSQIPPLRDAAHHFGRNDKTSLACKFGHTPRVAASYRWSFIGMGMALSRTDPGPLMICRDGCAGLRNHVDLASIANLSRKIEGRKRDGKTNSKKSQ